MLRELRLPDLGEGVTEGDVVTWLVAEGDRVEEDTPLVEVMTDKASVEIPSQFAGTVHRLHVEAGMTVPVGTVLVSVEDGVAAPASPVTEAAAPASPTSPAAAQLPRRAPALPSTRRQARELGVDLGDVTATGPRGRITDADVMRAVGSTAAPIAAAPDATLDAPASVAAAVASDRRVPLSGIRRRVAGHLVRALAVPTVTFVEEAEFDRLDALRERLAQRDGVRLSYLPFIVLGVCAALRRMPIVNSTLDEAAQDVVMRGEVNIGIATDTDEGLLVPVIHAADRLSVQQVHAAIAELAAAARAGTLRPEQLRGSTFTISSPGRWGGLMATPILNAPEAALLAVHRAQPRPVVRDGAVVVRTVGNLSLTFDHRIVDGITAATFTRLVIDAVEEPALLLSVGVPDSR